MTNEEQRIAIAKACGWTQRNEKGRYKAILRPDSSEMWHYDSYGNSYGPCCDWDHALSYKRLPIPDYINVLDAMHEAEKFLDSTGEYSERNHYASILGGLTYNDNNRGYKPLCNDDCYPIVHATAAQKAEAFLKAKKLWKDD